MVHNKAYTERKLIRIIYSLHMFSTWHIFSSSQCHPFPILSLLSQVIISHVAFTKHPTKTPTVCTPKLSTVRPLHMNPLHINPLYQLAISSFLETFSSLERHPRGLWLNVSSMTQVGPDAFHSLPLFPVSSIIKPYVCICFYEFRQGNSILPAHI